MTDYNRKMLNRIREMVSEQRHIDLPRGCERTSLKEQSVSESSILTEEESGNAVKPFVIRKNDIQFGSVRSSQEDAIRKTVGDVTFKEDALKYYPQADSNDNIQGTPESQDLVLNGEINGIGVTFQFRYKDPSGDGCYIWANGLQFTDSNNKTVDKIKDAFLNWKKSLVEDGDLLDKLNKEATKEH